jgi:hypothetical protein
MTAALAISLVANAVGFFALLQAQGQLNLLNAELRQLREQMASMADEPE